jgi:uncharacterized protein YcaQ
MILTPAQARKLWIRAQKLDVRDPFGEGPSATRAAIEHLGYVQIDTIHVIERCHHHILFTRIPAYRRADLHAAQTLERTVFEYWTHALAYVPTRDYRYFLAAMNRCRRSPSPWYASVKPADLSKVLRLIRRGGAISIRDINDDVLVQKTHPWASAKPSKRALQAAFYDGRLTISERLGMVKKYELSGRHFGWETRPKAASPREIDAYLLDRALRSQGLVSLDSICHLNAPKKADVKRLIDKRVATGELVALAVRGHEKVPHWARPEDLEASEAASPPELTHLLSPFDPLVILRKRHKAFFGYEHLFEAYLPKEKRVRGYFALPVLVGDRVVAALDLKTDRERRRLLVRKWTWMKASRSAEVKRLIEEELGRFEAFQLDT